VRLRNLIFVLSIVVVVGIFSCTAIAQSEDTLIIGRQSPLVQTMDPHFFKTHPGLEIKRCIYQGLVRYKWGTFGEVEPDLAESWEVSEDGLEWTFHLRKGVKWHPGPNGEDYGYLTAEDVKASLDRARREYIPDHEIHDPVDRVEVVDKYTVKIIFKHVDGTYMLSVLPTWNARIVPKKYLEKYDHEGLGDAVCGSGPYRFVRWEPYNEIVLTRFEDYWGEKPYFKKIIFKAIPEVHVQEMALKAGEIDIGRIKIESINSFEKNPNFNVYQGSGLMYRWLGMNVTRKPFDDIRVRWAVREAVNVQEILDKVWYGVPRADGTLVAFAHPEHWDEVPIANMPNIEKAKKLLAEAGYPNGFTATAVTVGGKEKGDQMLEIIQSQLAKVGIKLKITILDSGALVQALSGKRGDFDMYLYRYFANRTASMGLTWWHSGQYWNWSKWSNPVFDMLHEEAKRTLDPELGKEIFVNMQKIMWVDCPVIVIDHGVNVLAAQKYIDIGKLQPNGELVPQTIRKK